jgi:glutaminyl-peptide cyclotransferase
MKRKSGLIILCLLSPVLPGACCPANNPPDPAAAPRQYTFEIVHAHPHDAEAFTQGLLWHDGFLYESTGLNGKSALRRVALETGEVLQSRKVDGPYFAEGLALDGDRLVQLTWQSGRAFVYDRSSFEPRQGFDYLGEGWGLTTDGGRFIMSDGTAKLRFMDLSAFAPAGSVTVSDQGRPVNRLNELEYVDGLVYANVWQTNRIAQIDPATGAVAGWIDLTGLLSAADRGTASPDVLNGIAWDGAGKRLFVTGKRWPKLYEIRLIERAAPN